MAGKQNKDKVVFTEIGREKLSDTTDLVASTITKNGKEDGIAINPYLNTPKYQGPTKGFKVPTGRNKAVLKMLTKALA